MRSFKKPAERLICFIPLSCRAGALACKNSRARLFFMISQWSHIESLSEHKQSFVSKEFSVGSAHPTQLSRNRLERFLVIIRSR